MRKVRLALAVLVFGACGGDPVTPVHPTPAASSSSVAITTSPPAHATVVKRVVVSLSRPSGTSVTTTAADGTITVALDVLENGRGPHTDATIHLATDGTIASLDAKGHHEMGTPLEETFTRQGDHARWKSHEEKGDKDVNGPAFFIPIGELPDAAGWLVSALLKAGGTLALLPGGEAHLEATGPTTVRAHDQERKLSGYAITGVSLTPVRVWMNEDGSFFGIVSPWWSVIPEGWEPVIEPLIAKQNELDHARDADIARKFAHTPPAAGLAFTHARVLDVERGAWNKDQTVIVVGDTIKWVGAASAAKIPVGAEVVDLAGKALIPGLWDMHSHLDDDSGVLDIASGVTTARDVGNDPDKLDDFKKRYDDGSAVGPHVYRFGFIEGRGEKAASSKVTAENETEAKAAVEFFAERKYDGIKIYNSMKPELVPLLAKEAHARGMAVTGHIPVHMLANEAVRAGYDGVEHINQVLLNFLADHDTDTRTTKRFTLVGEKAGALDLRSRPVLDFIGLLKEHHTIIDPTLDAMEDLLCGEQGKITLGLEGLVTRLPVQTQRQFLVGGLPLEGDKHALYCSAFEKSLAFVKAMSEATIRVVVGTDSLPGLMVHHELALFVRAGLTPAQALRDATIEPARVLKQETKTGSIAVGKLADLVVIDGDPLVHIDDVGKVVTTVRGGVVFASAPLYGTVGLKPLVP